MKCARGKQRNGILAPTLPPRRHPIAVGHAIASGEHHPAGPILCVFPTPLPPLETKQDTIRTEQL